MDIKNISALQQDTVESIANIEDDTIDLDFEILNKYEE